MCSPDGHHLRVTQWPCQWLVQRWAHDPVLPSEMQEVLGVRLLKFCQFWRILKSQLIHDTTRMHPKNMIQSLKSWSKRTFCIILHTWNVQKWQTYRNRKQMRGYLSLGEEEGGGVTAWWLRGLLGWWHWCETGACWWLHNVVCEMPLRIIIVCLLP